MEFESLKQFDEIVVEHAIVNLFGGKLEQAISYIVIMAMSLGAQDAAEIMAGREDNDADSDEVAFFDAILPFMRLEIDQNSFNNEEQFNGSFLCHDDRPVISGITDKMIADVSRDDHKNTLRSEILTGIIQGRPFAKTVLGASYRVALLHCLQKLDVTIKERPGDQAKSEYGFFHKTPLTATR